MITSATRCLNSMQMHFESLPISLDDESLEGDEWQNFSSAHKSVRDVGEPRESP
jgi:hypothetical protein